MLVWESRDACNSICTVAKSSIRCSSRPIPSVEFSPTNSLEDEEKLFVHFNPLEQVHIVPNSHWLRDSYFSISSVLWMEMSSPSVANVIVCKIVDQPPDLMR
jgi:hypothetical protein